MKRINFSNPNLYIACFLLKSFGQSSSHPFCAILLLHSDVKNERFIVNGENLKYRDVFDWIADGFGKKRASIKVTPLLKEIAWRFEYILSFLTGEKALITRESANSAMTKSYYSTNKIDKFLGYKFTPIKDSIRKYCNWFSERID